MAVERPGLRTKRRSPLQPASAAAILGTDWIVGALSSFFELEPLSRAAVSGAIFCGIVVWLVEYVRRPSGLGAATAKGALACAVVAAPGLILGTTLAVGALAWSTLVHLAARSQRLRR